MESLDRTKITRGTNIRGGGFDHPPKQTEEVKEPQEDFLVERRHCCAV